MRLSFDALANYRGLVTLVDGSFDMLHPGHLAYFRAARSFGYPLLCHVCPDSYTAQKHPVLLPASDRADLLDALDLITYTHQEDRSTLDVLRQLQPAFYVKGADWASRLPTEQGQVCAELGIRIRYTETVTHSSSALLRSLQPDVDAFEKLVQSQMPADKPWEPVTDYSFAARRPIEQPHADVFIAAFQPKRVLDMGCGPGILMGLLAERGIGVHGIDKNAGGSGGGNVTRWDASSRALPWESWKPFDVVVAREIFEHLTILELRQAVRNMCDLTSKFCYTTTRFAKAPKHFLSVDTSDDLDPTHITMLNQDFLRTLFVLEGFTRRADLESRLDWKQLGRCLVYERAQ
jgi:glycerol-3-phosphate cytidylyltransferase-like family protein